MAPVVALAAGTPAARPTPPPLTGPAGESLADLATRQLASGRAPWAATIEDLLVVFRLGRDLGLSPHESCRCLLLRRGRLTAPAGALPTLINAWYGAGSLRVDGERKSEVWILVRPGGKAPQTRGRAQARAGEDPRRLRARALYRAAEVWFGDLLERLDIVDVDGEILGHGRMEPQGVGDQFFAQLDWTAAALGRAGVGGAVVPAYLDAVGAARLWLAWDRRLAVVTGTAGAEHG